MSPVLSVGKSQPEGRGDLQPPGMTEPSPSGRGWGEGSMGSILPHRTTFSAVSRVLRQFQTPIPPMCAPPINVLGTWEAARTFGLGYKRARRPILPDSYRGMVTPEHFPLFFGPYGKDTVTPVNAKLVAHRTNHPTFERIRGEGELVIPCHRVDAEPSAS